MVHLLLTHQHMTQKLLASTVITLLCAPALALAAPAGPASPTSSASATPFQFKLGVQQGADARSYDLTLAQDSCGEVQDRELDRTVSIKLCAVSTAQGTRFETSWELHNKTSDYPTRWQTIVTRGQTVEVGRTNGVRLTLQVK